MKKRQSRMLKRRRAQARRRRRRRFGRIHFYLQADIRSLARSLDNVAAVMRGFGISAAKMAESIMAAAGRDANRLITGVRRGLYEQLKNEPDIICIQMGIVLYEQLKYGMTWRKPDDISKICAPEFPEKNQAFYLGIPVVVSPMMEKNSYWLIRKSCLNGLVMPGDTQGLGLKRFTLGEIISVGAGKLCCEMGGLYRILNYLTGDQLYTHQLGRACRCCEPYIRAQFPWLAEVDTSGCTPEIFPDWIAEQERHFGASHAVKPLPPGVWTSMEPMMELVEMINRKKNERGEEQ